MNCLLYPYNYELSAFYLTFPYYNKELQITKLAAPKAWQYATDVPENVCYDFNEALQNVDCVIFADSPQNSFMYRDLVKKMYDTLKQNKHIICTVTLQIDDQTALTELADDSGLQFRYLVPDNKIDVRQSVYATQDCIVIGIVGMFKGIDTFSTLLHLAHRYRDHGYRVTAVSDNPNAALVGFVPLPTEVFDEKHFSSDGIPLLNTFYNQLQLRYQPDIILTQIPGGIVKYSDRCPDNFGLKAYAFSQAVNLDFLIMTVPANTHEEGFYAQISEISEKRFNCRVNAFGVTNKNVNVSISDEQGQIHYNLITKDSVSDFVHELKQKTDSGLFFFDSGIEESFEELCSYSIQYLSP